MLSPSAALRSVKLVHTLSWAFFAACIIAIPPMVWFGNQNAVLLRPILVPSKLS